jgi:hypothetical protein
MKKEIKWGNIPIKGLKDLSEYDMRHLAGIETGNNNVKSGHLKNISVNGGKSRGKIAHINLNKSQTFESRSKAHKKQIPKEKIEQAIKKFIFNKDRAEWLDITHVTFRKLCKEYGLYKKETTGEKFMKYVSASDRSKILNKNKNK